MTSVIVTLGHTGSTVILAAQLSFVIFVLRERQERDDFCAIFLLTLLERCRRRGAVLSEKEKKEDNICFFGILPKCIFGRKENIHTVSIRRSAPGGQHVADSTGPAQYGLIS